MLESLLLKNFQIHEYLKVKFDPHITVITGPNDRGKTALLRALRWLSLNKPSGEEFRRWGSKKTLALLKVDGEVIRRRRSSVNSYSLNSEEFRAFGTDVPAAIANLLNIRPENFQQQHDPIFWMTESPSQIARNLNEIINLQIIDDSLTNIANAQRRAKLLVEVSRDRLSDARSKKQELTWVPDFVRGVKVLEDRQAQIETLRHKQREISDLIEEVRQHQKTISSAKKPIETGRRLLERGQVLLEKKKQWKELNQAIEEYEKWLSQHEQITSQITKIQKRLKKVKTCPVCGARLKPSAVQTSTCH